MFRTFKSQVRAVKSESVLVFVGLGSLKSNLKPSSSHLSKVTSSKFRFLLSQRSKGTFTNLNDHFKFFAHV